jgi:predicted nucleic acid-binding protein
MKYVLDASIALCWVLPRSFSAKALKLRDDYINRVHNFIAPDHFPGEIANALTKAERQKLIPVGNAAGCYATILADCPILDPYFPLAARAIDISSKTRTAFYDCLYVALAEQEQCEVVTVDDKFINGIQKQFPFVIHLSALP